LQTWKLGALGAAAATGVLAIACSGGGGGGGANTPAKATSATNAAAATAATAKPAATSTSSTGGASAGLPADACTLLTLAEVQQVEPAAKDEGVPSSEGDPVSAVSCLWEWEDPTQGFGSLELTVSTLPPAASEEFVKQSLKVDLADAGANGRELPGIGDYAILKSIIVADAEVKALVGGALLRLDLTGFAAGGNARDRQDTLVPLAQAVAKRLGQ
jgi:hypothetical protein